MAQILLLNGAKGFGHSHGRLNTTLHDHALRVLKDLGHGVVETQIDQGYDFEEEVGKILSADALVWQMAGWWMGEPWIVKKYMDEVFTTGHGRLWKNDGRSHTAPTKNYGKGGLLQGKKYMFSLTWNAPLEAFIDKEEFFGGVGVDGVYLHLHKAHEFLGMQALPTFICNDVIKNPQVEQYLQNYSTHLQKVFTAF
ncbi:Modulator of drug activity [Helicobacter sp. NHP19-003]|uniref:Modulator of drug activity n=1 Tax=Helicobacter gastrocanis TaxID=2849641 RepID=A0ABM7S8K3_9HELI|nr:NAD(P)H-dependent oxidoreductase [Helicobacter sp. NHP19-003]BCZ16843.1 Modulator of drug activity [Helicobacter sp. NHP19-003]